MQDNEALGRLIVAARKLTDFVARADLTGEPITPRSPALFRHLFSVLGARDNEVVLAMFLDREGRFLAEELLGIGSSDQVEVALRPLIARALELAARQMILAHNHPSGDVRPSDADQIATDRLRGLAASLEIELVDHLIVTRAAIHSMATGREISAARVQNDNG